MLINKNRNTDNYFNCQGRIGFKYLHLASRVHASIGTLFFFFFLEEASNLHINLFIKLSPLLLGKYCSDCLQQKQANQNPFLSRISRGVGPTHPYLCDVKASFGLFKFRIKFVAAILLLSCGLKCAVFKRKTNHFEAVNRKNIF